MNMILQTRDVIKADLAQKIIRRNLIMEKITAAINRNLCMDPGIPT